MDCPRSPVVNCVQGLASDKPSSEAAMGCWRACLKTRLYRLVRIVLEPSKPNWRKLIESSSTGVSLSSVLRPQNYQSLQWVGGAVPRLPLDQAQAESLGWAAREPSAPKTEDPIDSPTRASSSMTMLAPAPISAGACW